MTYYKVDLQVIVLLRYSFLTNILASIYLNAKITKRKT